MNKKKYVIEKIKLSEYEFRYIILDAENKDIILDDAQGYGYKTRQKAIKAAWWKYDNGKNKTETKKDDMKSFYKQNPEINKFVEELFDINLMEIASGEITTDDIVKEVNDKFLIDIPINYIKYYNNK